MWDTVYFLQTADVVTQGSDCRGTAKWQNCRVLVDVALSPAAASVAVLHVTSWSNTKRFLSILIDRVWLWYLSSLRPWCGNCGYDVTRIATFLRYQLPPSSRFKFRNSFPWNSVQLRCSYSRTLDRDMIEAVLRNVAGFINISTTKRGKRIDVQKFRNFMKNYDEVSTPTKKEANENVVQSKQNIFNISHNKTN